MKKYYISTTAITAFTLVPSVVFAAKSLKDIAKLAIDYFNLGVYFIMSLAILFFVWNVFRYFFKADGDKGEAGKYVMFGVIGFFVIISFWGLVNIITHTLNLDNQCSGPYCPSSSGSTQQTPFIPSDYNNNEPNGGSKML